MGAAALAGHGVTLTPQALSEGCQPESGPLNMGSGPAKLSFPAEDVTERESAHHHENDGKGHVAVYKSKTTRRGRSQPQQRHSTVALIRIQIQPS